MRFGIALLSELICRFIVGHNSLIRDKHREFVDRVAAVDIFLLVD